ncbi:Uncharacterised protein [Mycobacteroides abscessus subsp. massiliense]|nr:Uncharacterised protein [Mycobacteroides abscessus subsp. massiliense]
MQIIECLYLVTEEFDANGQLFVGRDDLDGVSAYPEGAAGEGHVIAVVLHVDQQPQQRIARHLQPHVQLHRTIQVRLRSTQSVDA